MKNNKISCPTCKSKEVVKRGYFHTEAHGKQQRYFCKNCNKKFILKTAFYRMRNNEKKITLCLDLFYKGISTRRIQEHLQAFYPHNSDHSTIYRWIIRYSKQVAKFTEQLKLKVGYGLQIDEMEFNRRKSHNKKLGVDKNWFIDMIDQRTKFIVSSNYCKTRGQEEIIKILKTAKEKTESQVTRITTDGYTAYENAIRHSFGLVGKNKYFGVQHKRVNASQGQGFNYPIERLHNSVRQRTQNFRGFHGSIESANLIMRGFEIYYNFIRKHQTLGKTPSDLATDLKLKENNRWLELINLSN
jgi:transposase-like protein